MKPGPKKGAGVSVDRLFVDKVVEAWADPEQPVPAWIIVLAETADARGLVATGEAIGYSGSLVSAVLGNKYDGNLVRVSERVHGALMGVTVECPHLGEMTRDTCLDWQANPFAATSSLRVDMYHACRSGCPHSRIKGGGDGL